MKLIISPSLFFGLCLLSLLSCKKTSSNTPKLDNYFILEHYTGVRDTFRLNSISSMDFDFRSYRSSSSGLYVKHFRLFKGAFADNYELSLAKPDDAITIGQVYRTNTANQVTSSFTRTVLGPIDIVNNASITDIQFSEYKAAERISGSFKAYANGLLWFKGEFCFIGE